MFGGLFGAQVKKPALWLKAKAKADAEAKAAAEANAAADLAKAADDKARKEAEEATR